jgi:hypothetical protein
MLKDIVFVVLFLTAASNAQSELHFNAESGVFCVKVLLSRNLVGPVQTLILVGGSLKPTFRPTTLLPLAGKTALYAGVHERRSVHGASARHRQDGSERARRKHATRTEVVCSHWLIRGDRSWDNCT